MLSVLAFQAMLGNRFLLFEGSSVHITYKKSATTAEPEKNESHDHHPCQAKSTFFWGTFLAALKH